MTVTFRAGVGVVVTDGAGLVLVCERSDWPGAWQFPQGGLDAGEAPAAAAGRELEEETAISADQVELVAEVPEWLAYEVPAEHRKAKTGWGQVQRWYLFRLLPGAAGPDLARAKDDEFSAFRWVTLAEAAEGAVEFRQPVYRRLLAEFAPLVDRASDGE